MAFPEELPTLPATGIPPKLRAVFVAVLDFIDRRQPLPTIGGVETPHGIIIPTGGSAGSAGAPATPFRLLDQSTAKVRKIRVVYGTVNNAAPAGMSDGDTPQYILSGLGLSGKIYVVITITFNSMTGGFVVTSRSIGTGSVLPADDLPPEDEEEGEATFYRQLGTWSAPAIDGGGFAMNIAQDVTTSLWFDFCGGISALWGTA